MTCPSWCVGCKPGDAYHRDEPITLGDERYGWMTVQMIRGHAVTQAPRLKIDATGHSTTQTVVLTRAGVPLLISALAKAHHRMAQRRRRSATERSTKERR